MATIAFQDGRHCGHLGHWKGKFFRNSESPCRLNSSHQVLAQSDLPLKSRCGLKCFKMTTRIAISRRQGSGLYFYKNAGILLMVGALFFYFAFLLIKIAESGV